MTSQLVGYELRNSEAALHTVVVPTTKTEGAGWNSGTAAAANDTSWTAGAGAGGGGNNWLKYDFGSPQALVGFKMAAMITSGWTVEGSDNDSTWDTITPGWGVGPWAGATLSQGIADFDGTVTYRYWKISIPNWQYIGNIEFYSAYNPGEFRVWGPNPYQSPNNQADTFIEGDAGFYYADGGGSHVVGFMFDTAAVIDEFTFTAVTAQTVNLEFSDNGYDWTVSDSGLVLLAATPYVMTPTSNTGHMFWRIPIANWAQFDEVAYTLVAPAPPAEPEAPAEVSGGYSGAASRSPNAQSWRLALDKRRKYGRSQYWK